MQAVSEHVRSTSGTHRKCTILRQRYWTNLAHNWFQKGTWLGDWAPLVTARSYITVKCTAFAVHRGEQLEFNVNTSNNFMKGPSHPVCFRGVGMLHSKMITGQWWLYWIRTQSWHTRHGVQCCIIRCLVVYTLQDVNLSLVTTPFQISEAYTLT